MPKAVRIIALIMAILMGVSAIGMIAMYISAETCEGIGISASLSSMEKENESLNQEIIEFQKQKKNQRTCKI